MLCIPHRNSVRMFPDTRDIIINGELTLRSILFLIFQHFLLLLLSLSDRCLTDSYKVLVEGFLRFRKELCLMTSLYISGKKYITNLFFSE